jgi:hypothetical protein
MANAVPDSQRGAIWTRISLSLNPGLRATMSYGWRRNACASRVN